MKFVLNECCGVFVLMIELMHIETIVHFEYLVSKSESGINLKLRRISNLPLILARKYCMR